ncbi:hypothetical protein E4U26_000756, partial [Claviceps purpurea]
MSTLSHQRYRDHRSIATEALFRRGQPSYQRYRDHTVTTTEGLVLPAARGASSMPQPGAGRKLSRPSPSPLTGIPLRAGHSTTKAGSTKGHTRAGQPSPVPCPAIASPRPFSISIFTVTAAPRTRPRTLAHGLTIHRSSVSSLRAHKRRFKPGSRFMPCHETTNSLSSS